MDNYTTFLKRVLLVMIAFLLASCAGMDATTTKEGKPISPGELIYLKGGGSVRAPEGRGWRVRTSEMGEEIGFETVEVAGKVTFISIFSRYAESSSISQTEDQAAALIFDNEERIMRERGSARRYYPKDLLRENTTIGKKKLHVMKYTISDHSRLPVEIKYAMYLYFPDYTKLPRYYCIFLIGDVFKIKKSEYVTTEFNTDLTVINKVIESYQHE